MQLKSYRDLLLFIPGALLVGALYWPGLTGTFVFDEVVNIVQNQALLVTDLSWTSLLQLLQAGVVGETSRALAYLSFGINIHFSGMDAYSLKLTNVIIHLLTYFVLWRFSRRLLIELSRKTYIESSHVDVLAFLLASLWALHPLQHSTVLYIVQRMTLMSTFFVALGLYGYVWIRQCDSITLRSTLFAYSAIVICVVAAYYSKQNGILLLVYIAVLELMVFRLQGLSLPRQALAKAAVIGLGIFALLATTLLLQGDDGVLGAYAQREFTLTERLLSELRIVWSYVYWIVVPDMSNYALYHDDIAASHSLFDPISTFYALVAWLLAGCVCIAAWFKRQIWPLGIALFLSGHSIESTFLPLELTFEHRNYFPSFGILLAVLLATYALARRFEKIKLAVATACVMLLTNCVNSYARSVEWGDHLYQFVQATNRHPDSSRAHNELVNFFGANYVELIARGGVADKVYEQMMEHARRAGEATDSYVTSYVAVVTTHLRAGQVPPARIVMHASERLSRYPLHAESINAVHSLVRCLSSKDCTNVEKESVRPVLEAILANDTLGTIMADALRCAYVALYAE